MHIEAVYTRTAIHPIFKVPGGTLIPTNVIAKVGIQNHVRETRALVSGVL